jgi:hypothetical protein
VTATRDYDGLIVQRIVDVRKSGVGAVRGLLDFDGAFHHIIARCSGSSRFAELRGHVEQRA